MKIFSRTVHATEKFPLTQVITLLDGQLIIFLRSWGSSDYNQKFIDEVTHYLSSAQADLDVTTPFEHHENLSSLANRTRVALLLAHDLFFKNENKSEYVVGFEAMLVFKVKNEMAWSAVGRFAVDKVSGNLVDKLMQNGTDLDSEVLLPVQLLGVERDIDITSGSAVFNENSRIVISSTFKSQLTILPHLEEQAMVDASVNEGAYWFSVLSAG